MQILRKKITTVFLLSALVAVAAGGCGQDGAAPPADGMTAEEASVLTVQIENPSYASIYLTSEMVGTVEPERTAEVYPKTSGTVTAVYFETGDFVEEGQTLATLDSDSLNTAAINIETAQLQLETAQKKLERTQVLYENDGVTQQALESAENAVQSAQLQLASAQDNYNTLQKNISITAPISGVIESRDVDVYDNASAQQAICVISQKQSMQVVFQVPERVKNVLSMGTTVTLEKNSKEYQAVVDEISSKTVEGTGLFGIKARIKDGAALSTGSKVTVELVTDKAEQALCIPVDAVYYDNGAPYVFVSNQGTAEIVYLETGIYDDTHIQVVSGLDATTQVITSWSSQLTNGVAVQSAADAEKETAAAGTDVQEQTAESEEQV